MRRWITGAVLLITALSALVGCGTKPDATGTKRIEVTIKGDAISPSGQTIEVARGQKIELVITADKPGQLGLHASPEQDFNYQAGTKTFRLTIDRPGVAELESHTLDKVIAQLKVQ